MSGNTARTYVYQENCAYNVIYIIILKSSLEKHGVRFQVLKATKIKITVLCDVTTKSSVDIHKYFRKTHEDGGTNSLRNVYIYQPARFHIL
jgi:hypothetical protein